MAGQNEEENGDEELSTSGVSTVNSSKTKPKKYEFKIETCELGELKVENVRLMQDLIESHKLYQALLKSSIEEQRLNLDLLRNLSTAVSTATTVAHQYQRSISLG